MKNKSLYKFWSARTELLGTVAWRSMLGASGAAAMLLGAAGSAQAFNLYDGQQAGNNLEINLTTNFSYTLTERVNNPSKILEGPGNANGNDSDSNFQHGIVGNELAITPTLDLRDGEFGAHISGIGYVNTVYLGTNQNSQPGTFNPYTTVDNQHFTSATRNVNGENIRLLDAFVYGRKIFNDGSFASLKLGRQTLLWGQSLYFTGNGVAAGQAPVDVVQATSLINPEAQAVFMPVGQAVATYQINPTYILQAYYQFEYQHDYFNSQGSYYNSADILDKGGQRLILGPSFYAYRTKDLDPEHQNGQFGAAVLGTFGNYDVGLYALRFDAKAPEVYIIPGVTYNYQLVYPRDTGIFGTSLSTTVGPANVAGEISGRINQPLVSGGLISLPTNPGNASSNPLYAVGDTFHAQVSELYSSPGIPGDPGGVGIDSEVEFNHLITVTKNRSALATGRQASAAAFDLSLTPTYYDVLPNLEVTFPISVTYSVLGRSEVDASMQHGTGNFTLGINGTYKSVWVASLTYKDYLGKPDANNGLADRGFVALNLQYTF